MSGPLRFADHITPTPAMLAWLDDANKILEEEGTPQFEALARARYGDLTPDQPEQSEQVTIADNGTQ